MLCLKLVPLGYLRVPRRVEAGIEGVENLVEVAEPLQELLRLVEHGGALEAEAKLSLKLVLGAALADVLVVVLNPVPLGEDGYPPLEEAEAAKLCPLDALVLKASLKVVLPLVGVDQNDSCLPQELLHLLWVPVLASLQDLEEPPLAHYEAVYGVGLKVPHLGELLRLVLNEEGLKLVLLPAGPDYKEHLQTHLSEIQHSLKASIISVASTLSRFLPKSRFSLPAKALTSSVS